MEVIAHRGFAEVGVENALPTLRRATDTAEAVEFDVRLSRDGEPVVFHDRTLDRLTDRHGAVADRTAGELTTIALAGRDATIPTLATVLDELSGPVVADVKAERVTDRLVELLADYGDPLLVSSVRPELLASVGGSLETALLCGVPAVHDGVPAAGTTLAEAVGLATDLDACAVHPHHSLCTPDAVERAHAAGLRVNAWTVRSRTVAAGMRRVGVDGVIADAPEYVEE